VILYSQFDSNERLPGPTHASQQLLHPSSLPLARPETSLSCTELSHASAPSPAVCGEAGGGEEGGGGRALNVATEGGSENKQRCDKTGGGGGARDGGGVDSGAKLNTDNVHCNPDNILCNSDIVHQDGNVPSLEKTGL